MRAVIQTETGNPNSLTVERIDIPTISGRELLIKVKYAALNRLDILQAKSLSPVIPIGASEIIGVEVSGIVIDIGPECSLPYALNDEVMALLPGGGYAEFCVCDERTVFHIPMGIPMHIAAAIPEAFMTAYKLLFYSANVESGDSVLIHAGASSVGQAAIQMAKLKGAFVIATARSAEKCQLCADIGADLTLLISNRIFASKLKDLHGGKGVNVVLDPVGNDYLDENLNVLEIDGRLVLYGLLSGGAVHDDGFLSKVLSKRIQLLSSTLRSRSIEWKESLKDAVSSDPCALAAIQSGEIKVLIDKIFPLDDVIASHEYMSSNHSKGKILLNLFDE